MDAMIPNNGLTDDMVDAANSPRHRHQRMTPDQAIKAGGGDTGSVDIDRTFDHRPLHPDEIGMRM